MIITEALVRPNEEARRPRGGRAGTCIAPRAEMEFLFGPSHTKPSGDGKVTHGWFLDTPRGVVEIRDYWWNAAYEYSIAAESRKAALWACRYLRRKGFRAGRSVCKGAA